MNGSKPYDANRFDVQVIERLTRIETKLESVPKLWEKVNEHEKSINRAKGGLSILGCLWTLITVIMGKFMWSHGKW